MVQKRRKVQRKQRQGRRRVAKSKQSRERRRIEREQEKLRKMSLKFGKTIAPNFGRALQNSKRQLTRHPYLNFLRHFKSTHPSYGFARILREGAKKWKRMGRDARENFSQKAVLRSLRANAKVCSDFNLFPTSPIPFDYYKRSLSVRRNVERRTRNRQLMPRPEKRDATLARPRRRRRKQCRYY